MDNVGRVYARMGDYDKAVRRYKTRILLCLFNKIRTIFRKQKVKKKLLLHITAGKFVTKIIPYKVVADTVDFSGCNKPHFGVQASYTSSCYTLG